MDSEFPFNDIANYTQVEDERSRSRNLQRQQRHTSDTDERHRNPSRPQQNELPTGNTSTVQEGTISGSCRLIPLHQHPFGRQQLHDNTHEASTSRAQDNFPLPDDNNFGSDEDINSDEEIDIQLPGAETRNLHNIARDYIENQGTSKLKLKDPTICTYCQALIFDGEKKTFCCKNGRLLLSAIPIPPELQALYTDQTAEARKFRNDIRKYNHVFSFTSMGVSIDQRLANAPGVFVYRAHGLVFHKIGTLLPTPGQRPRYLQMFIYDTEQETNNRLEECNGLDRSLLEKLKRILDSHNPFVKNLRHLAQRPDLPNCQLLIRERPSNERQYVVPSASQVAAVICCNDDLQRATNRDIIVQTIGGQLITLKEFSGYYDPLQYTLFHPYGTYGWDINSRTLHGNKITCADYYSYMLQIRTNPSILLHGGRLLHQYAVDNHIKIETQRLTYLRMNQDKIRAELYDGLQDCLNAGEMEAANVGQRTVLPSSFTGSPRDMYQRYQDAMAIVRKYGKPDVFLTMTCNPNWTEIKEQLLPGQTPQDRPDLLTRIFRAKYEKLKQYIYKRGVLGHTIGHVHVVEFQKRGLPHVHMLVIFSEMDKPNTPESYDSIVSAEIPDPNQQPLLYAAVLKHMIHGPCGLLNPNAPCMKKQQPCSKKYPKQFQPCTIQGNDSYPIYRRRDNNIRVALDGNGERLVDNRWVVPYNPWLLLKFDCHINVEICSSIKSIKYLYKYIHKGPDCAQLEVRTGPNFDEINKYVNGRWICAPEAFWKLYKFPISRIYPSVVRLQLHLPKRHQVPFRTDQTIADILADDINKRSMLTEFFKIYAEGLEDIKYLYSEFPIYYRWNKTSRTWTKRRSSQKVIGRIYAASPAEGERFYLRLLLNHVRGPKSFEDLLTVHGVNVPCTTFRQAAEKYGLLEEDDSILQCLMEAATERVPAALRRLFVTILIFCEPTCVRKLWDETYAYMTEDYDGSSTHGNVYVRNRLLHDINILLSQHSKSLKDFDLPQITEQFQNIGTSSNLVAEELLIPISEDDLNSVHQLNTNQKHAFDTIRSAISARDSVMFFVDGPGGTGKTFLYRSLLASCRQDGFIILATASSGIAATQLPGGRTAHSKLKIPIKLHAQSLCTFSKQSDMCQLIRQCSAIIWDEAPMANKNAIETLDRTLRDMLDIDLPFGGKVVIFGGDFRQVVPVVVGGTRVQMIHASMVESYLWPDVKILKLVENVRAIQDPSYSAFLLRVGNGEEPKVADDMIQIPDPMVIEWMDDSSMDSLVTSIFPDLEANLYDSEYMTSRAIITPLNEDVNKLNDRVLGLLSNDDEVTYYSFDSVEDDSHNLFLPEFLNSVSPGNLPPHKLTLKKGCPIMLLRNIDPKIGLCNGTRLMCRQFHLNFIDAEILVGPYKGTRVFLPRISLKTSEDAKLPFEMKRKQFPVRLSFALTINKSQGQTIPHVGIYLPNHVFSHGQLYVALSRGISISTTKVLVKNGKLDGHEGVFTRNVVYEELFSKVDSNNS